MSSYTGDAETLNRELTTFHENKAKFDRETNALPGRRQRIGASIEQVHGLQARLENAASVFRAVSDQAIRMIEANLGRSRELLLRTPLDAYPELESRTDGLPQELRMRYLAAYRHFLVCSNEFKTAVQNTANLIAGLQASLDRSKNVQSSYCRLTCSCPRLGELENEKHAIEAGCSDVQLMDTESMWRMQQAVALLEQIQARVDAASPQYRSYRLDRQRRHTRMIQ